jgi:5'-methylthioadenosine phosphorylase
MFADPVCADWSDRIYRIAESHSDGRHVHSKGTYLNMEGPAFSTKSESHLYRSWGMDVIGMTNCTEAKLAREAEICFAAMAMVTDYDCWMEEKDSATVNVEMIVHNLQQNGALAKTIIRELSKSGPGDRNCSCGSALQNAIITTSEAIPSDTAERLALLIGRYV